MVSARRDPAPFRGRLARLVAGLVAVAWLAIAVAFLVGGTATTAPPTDWLLLAVCALLPAGLSATAVIVGSGSGRPRASTRGHTIAVLSGLLALILLVPLLLLVTDPVLAGTPLGRQTVNGAEVPVGPPVVLPSPEVAYAGLLALAASAVQAGQLLGRSPVGVLAMAGAAAGTAVLLGAAPVIGGMRAAPGCLTVPSVPTDAIVTMTAEARIDGRPIGSASLDAERDGADVRWSGRAEGELVDDFKVEAADDGYELDVALQALLAGRSLAGAENLGVESFAGEPARRCRLLIDGTTAIDVLPPARWLVDGPPGAEAASLDIWRGELDWWVGRDGRLLGARVHVGGHPADAWGVRALRGELSGTLSVSLPEGPVTIEEPLP